MRGPVPVGLPGREELPPVVTDLRIEGQSRASSIIQTGAITGGVKDNMHAKYVMAQYPTMNAKKKEGAHMPTHGISRCKDFGHRT